MKLSPEAIKVICHHEGIRYKPYRCPAKLWTIGVGHVYFTQTKLRYQWIKEALTSFGQKIAARFQRTK